MIKGYIYTISDGVGDVFKFGYTTDPLSRLCKYNATECLRPMRYEIVAEYKTEKESRDVETSIKSALKSQLYNQVAKPEVAIDTPSNRKVVLDLILASNPVSIDLNKVYNTVFEQSTNTKKFDYKEAVNLICEKALGSGIDKSKIKDLIVEFSVGYEFEKAPPRVIFENRRKKLIDIDGVELFYDTKPKLIERLQRLSLLDYTLKTSFFTK